MNLQTLTMAALLLDEAADLLEALGPDKLADHPKFRFPLADELGGAASMLRDMHQQCAASRDALREFVPEHQSGTLTERERIDKARAALAAPAA